VIDAGACAPWADNTAYSKGDCVTYMGSTWRCDIPHTSQPTWAPGLTGVYLWSKVN
jgi:hypothetical protein